jgi:hypothetical protein
MEKMVCPVQDTRQTFEKTPSGGQATCLRPTRLIRLEEKNQSRTAEEASKSKTTRVDSPTASVESHVSVESSLIEFPSDPAWRRKYIALQHVRRLMFDEFVQPRLRVLMPASGSRRQEGDVNDYDVGRARDVHEERERERERGERERKTRTRTRRKKEGKREGGRVGWKLSGEGVAPEIGKGG